MNAKGNSLLNIEAGEFLEELDQLEHFHMLRQ